MEEKRYMVVEEKRITSLALFFFFRIALAILGLLLLHIHFRIICSISMKNVMGNVIGIALNLALCSKAC